MSIRVVTAATRLIADVRRRYPGEDLKCPLMRELDAALTEEAGRGFTHDGTRLMGKRRHP